MGLLRWVSNRLGFKSATWISDWWLCWFDGLMAWVSDRRGFDGLCLCVKSVYHGPVYVALCVEPVLEVEGD